MLLAVALFGVWASADFWSTLWWFESQGQAGAFWLRTTAPWMVGLAGALIGGLFAAINLVIAMRLARPQPIYRGQIPPLPVTVVSRLAWTMVIVIAAVLGLSLGPNWERVLLAVNGGSFGLTDPLFGLDIGFYVFILPVLNTGRIWLIEVLVLVMAAVSLWYLAQANVNLRRGQLQVPGPMRGHLAVLGSLILLVIAAGYLTAGFELVYSRRGTVVGAGYADINAQLPVYRALIVVAVLAAVGLLVYVFRRRRLLLLGSLALWPAAALLGQIYPSVIQNVVVRPNEYGLESPYIEHNIRMTRAAFGLDQVEVRELSGRETLTAADLRASGDTVRNLRLWDIEPLRATFEQTQELRLYYAFVDVDVDRYRLDNQYRQVMIAARELDQSKLAAQAQTWQNRHLVYTHGYGAVVSPVNEQRPEGLPRFLLENIPPTGHPALALTRPQIYFGEKTDQYVFVRTVPSQPGEGPEFDYPLGDTNATTTYDGRDGIVLDSPVKRMVMAFALADSNVLFSRNFTPETRVLIHRTIQDRLQLLAPFLAYDRDPYLVLLDGRLVWVQDAYTSSGLYPYSTPVTTRGLGRVNYLRNSVKATVDAYDGTVTFYVAEENEPILRAYRALYPNLFTPLSAAPPKLREHLRYPEDLFNIQSQVYATYHMRNSQVFYNREDAWAVPQTQTGDRAEPMSAYYVMMTLPEARDELEFMLMRPFTPQGKANMVAWMVARSDGDSYGTLRVYAFPKERVLFGPQQIDARINQEPEISQQLTLWNQHGSKVIRGNLLVVPMRETLLYVQPLYIQAENSRLPELKRVIVASSEKVVMGNDLASALERLVGTAPGGVAAPVVSQPSQPPVVSGEVGDLARQARAQYQQAQEALRRGDWAAYGTALKALEATLDRLASAP